MHGAAHAKPRVEALLGGETADSHLWRQLRSHRIGPHSHDIPELQWDPELNFYIFAVMAS